MFRALSHKLSLLWPFSWRAYTDNSCWAGFSLQNNSPTARARCFILALLIIFLHLWTLLLCAAFIYFHFFLTMTVDTHKQPFKQTNCFAKTCRWDKATRIKVIISFISVYVLRCLVVLRSPKIKKIKKAGASLAASVTCAWRHGRLVFIWWVSSHPAPLHLLVKRTSVERQIHNSMALFVF